MIVRAKYANTLDWRQGQRLGKNDLLVTVSKPDDASCVMFLLCLKGICFRGSALAKGAWVMGRWGTSGRPGEGVS